ncbi:hypothetical protein HPO96_26745 [Kribbella sandramycini]|uniref:MoaD/ThiS family protein n=1 Tax=Kribbella sandramycini TaxID=60450 RepID=A0A7Y4L3X0_9ACTN|nr:hypothetical protein [Kribbella sandramycini]MBB6570709.1 hypothetical protein [Kribbella sandramycini]NOL43852.1 hypothetical protein [Kribbella sandramycini]
MTLTSTVVVRLRTVLRPFGGGAEEVEIAPVREVVAALKPALRRRLQRRTGRHPPAT